MRYTVPVFAIVSLAQAAFAQLPPPPVPAGNPITDEKAMLGKALFWDEQLSSTRTVSCGTCHIPEAGGSDPRTSLPGSVNPGPDGTFGTPDDVLGSRGVPRSAADGTYVGDPIFGLHEQVTGRRAPSAINAGYSPTLFWDGRAGGALVDPLTDDVILPEHAALESQVLGPILSEAEMAHEGRGWDDVIERLETSLPLALSDFVPGELNNWIASRTYPELFEEVFGTDEITPVRIAMAIATYERTLLALQTPWDAILGGAQAADVLTPQEINGIIVFLSAGGTFGNLDACDRCHGPNIARFSDDDFHYIGVRPQDEDLGRFNETGDPEDRGAMRTPNLRNLELRAPYFHNGSAATIEDVIEFYDRGGDFHAPNNTLEPLNLSDTEKADLAAFMKRPLTDPRVAAGMPPFDRPSQYADSVHVPEHFGVGTEGTDGIIPTMVAIEPPKVGNPNLTLGISDALGGALSVLLMDPVPDINGTVLYGATFHVGLSPSLLRPLVPLGGAGLGGGEGFGSYTIDVPDEPSLIGTSLYAQWMVFDPESPVRFSATDAVELRWF